MADTNNSAASVTSRTAIGAGWMVAWRMVTRSLGLVSTLILARLLVPADFGLVALATAFAASIESLSEIGLNAALVRLPQSDPSLYDTAFTMQAIRGILTGAVIAASTVVAGSWFDDERLVPLILILAGVAVAGGFNNIAVVQFQRELRFDMEFRLLFVPRILQFVVTTALAFTLRSYWALVIGLVVSRLSRIAMSYLVQPYRPRLTLSRWRDLAGFSFWSWACSMATMVWERSDSFVLGPVLGVGQLGIFLLATEIGLLPTTELVAPATNALYAGVAAAQNRGTEPVTLALPLMAALLMLVLPIGLGISATAGHIVLGLLGPTWVAGRPVIAVYAMLCLITPITFVSAVVLNAAGHVQQNFWATAGAAVLRVTALCLVAGYQRLDWVAFAVYAVVAGEAALFLTQLSRRGRLAWREAMPGTLRTLFSGAVVAAVLWETGLGWRDVTGSPFEALAMGIATGLGCIAGCAALQLTLWAAAGRPNGPEATVVSLFGEFAAKLRRRAGVA